MTNKSTRDDAEIMRILKSISKDEPSYKTMAKMATVLQHRPEGCDEIVLPINDLDGRLVFVSLYISEESIIDKELGRPDGTSVTNDDDADHTDNNDNDVGTTLH